MNLAGKNVLILGLAREGASLARFLVERGAAVTVTDAAGPDKLAPRISSLEGLPVQTVLGGHHAELVREADLFFVSPGVPETNPVYQAALQAGLAIQSMTTLFFDLCPSAIVGVTGSSGKTTTTGLIGHILRQAPRDVVVGGNIGDPMLDLLPHIQPDTTVVLELSSFQLGILRRSPHIAVVTNISPNHLDRHGTMEAYVDAKVNIVRHQTASDFAVLNARDSFASAFAAATPASIRQFGAGVSEGATAQDGQLGLVRDGRFAPVMSISDSPLLGQHNVENVLAALAAGDILGIGPEDMAAAVRTFRPAPHRLETVAERDGVRYVDDSIATSPARALVALRAIEAPVLLVAGGRDKNLPWEDFADLAVQKTRSVFLIGEAAPLIEESLKRALNGQTLPLRPENIRRCTSLEEAVIEAGRVARPGDVVLLSPGCTSYDMFTDFEERGRVFAQIAEGLCAA